MDNSTVANEHKNNFWSCPDDGSCNNNRSNSFLENHPPEAADQDISVNANSPIRIKLEANDPDDDKLKFVLDSKPSHGRIAQFSNLVGTLAYIPDANYDGKDEFTFKVHDGLVFSNDAKVSIKIQNNEKPSNDQMEFLIAKQSATREKRK